MFLERFFQRCFVRVARVVTAHYDAQWRFAVAVGRHCVFLFPEVN